MKIVLASLLASGVAAFAPSASKSSTVALNAAKSKYADELGVQTPLGFWDPLGVFANIDNDDKFTFFRDVEITHGRTAMLAIVGQLVTRAGIHFDGSYEGVAYADIPPGLAAFDVMPPSLVANMVASILFLECFMRNVEGTGNEFIGDYRNGWIDFGWDKLSEDDKMRKRSIELNNGRAAQMGILGLIVHEQMHTNMPIIGQL